MKIFDLRFTDAATMQSAFQRAQDRSAVDTCTLAPGELRMRFVARDAEADELAHKIYLDGGLKWCSGYVLTSRH
jgi:hypothetical protein